MTKAEQQAWRKELADLTVDELNARNEELEAEKNAIRAKQLALVEVRATRQRADRVAELDARDAAPAPQHAKAGVVEVKGNVVR